MSRARSIETWLRRKLSNMGSVKKKQMAKRNKKVNNKPYERIQKYFQWKPASQRNQACKCKSHINQKSIDLFPHDASPQWTIKQVVTSVKKFPNLNRQLYINFQVLNLIKAIFPYFYGDKYNKTKDLVY